MTIGAGSPSERKSAIRTFVIADVRGYTAFSKRYGDEAAARLATKFADIAREGVEAAGGELIETRGDEILASFASARSALRAAVELQDAFADETAVDPSLPLAVGMGIAAGEAVPVGDGFRGRALNLAARLCAQAQAGEVLTGEELVRLAGPVDGIVFGPLEPLDLKGFDEPVPVTRIAALEAASTPSPMPAPTEAGADLPAALDPAGRLFGRQHELRFLRWAWRRARHGHGRAVFVVGASGMGKTRLAAELARAALAEGADVRYARCAGPAQEALDELRDAEIVERPTLVVADDLDAAGGTVLDAARALASSLDQRPLLLLATYRELSSPLVASLVDQADPSAEARVVLTPLGAAEVRSIASVYAGPALAGLPLEELVAESGSVPALVHRAAAEWAQERASGRLSSAARRTSAGRSGLRAAEDELADNVVELERARERARLYVDEIGDAVVCPFKGLATFDAADAEYFCGRERLVAELVAQLVGTSFLGVVGPSGSGKSSAVRAGLVPALATGVIPGSEAWAVRLVRPGKHPLAALEGALADRGPGPLVLVLDQFEELFTACEDENERVEFVGALAEAMAGDVVVVVALRADFYGRCAGYPALAELLGRNQVLVGPMAEDELRRAIEVPARRAGLRVEPELVEALVADVGHEPGGLPLLSTALLELWQRRQGRTLTLERYRETDGVGGAVARLAEEAYGRLSPEQQRLARLILLRLAGPGDGGSLVRRRAELDEFDVDHDEDAARVLSVLTDARLLTTSEDTVEVAHEALLREWPRLRSWLDEDAEGRRLHLHLTQAASDWEQGGQEDADLYRGPRLGSALDWTAGRAVELNRRERRFLEASRARSVQEAERERRSNRRLRLLLGGSAVLLAVATVAGMAALVQQRRAERETDRAERASSLAGARELALSAEANLDVDPQRSLLLALEAVETTRAVTGSVVREAAEALHNAVTATRPRISFIGRAGQSTAAGPDGKRFVATGYVGGPGGLGMAAVWEADTAKRVLTLGRGATSADYGPEGRLVVTAAADGVATVWDARTGRKVRSVVGGRTRLLAAEFGPTDDLLATVTADGIVGVWNVQSGRALHELRAWTGATPSVSVGQRPTRAALRPPTQGDVFAFDADAGRLAIALPRGRRVAARVWDLRSGAPLLSVPATRDPRPVDVDLSSDGRVLAVAHATGRLELRDVDSGRLLLSRAARTFDLSDVEFHPDGNRLAITGLDGRVKLLDAHSGRELLSLKLIASYGDRALIESPLPSVLSFSRGGDRLISSGDLGIVHVWMLDLDEVEKLARSRIRRSLTADECRQYLHRACPEPRSPAAPGAR